MKQLLCIALGYVSGGILFSYYIPLWWKGIDVTRDTPDGNPGAFNCIHKAGWPIGLLALACDVLKGLLPVYLSVRVLGLDSWALALAIAAPVMGHAHPLFRHFRGGKAIAVSFGVTLGLFPLWQPFGILAACYLLFTLVVRLQPHRFRSIVTYLCFGAAGLVYLGATPVGFGCLLTASIVARRHRLPEPGEGEPSVSLALKRQGQE